MEKVPQKYDFDIFQRIINALLINSAFIGNIGLMHGKMGIAIFFAHLHKETNDSLFEKMFDMLIDEIFEEITITTPPDFEDGLAGIGWGIEYLVKRGFIEANTDEVLETLDRKIGQILPYDVDNVGLLTGYCGYGLYLVKRIKSSGADREKDKNEELELLLELVIAGVNKAINSNLVDLNEPTKFDLSWDVIVLLLFIKEISSIDRFSSWYKDHGNLISYIQKKEYLLPENKIAVAILSGKQLSSGDSSILKMLLDSKQCYINDGFLRFCTLLCLSPDKKNGFDFSGIIDILRSKLLSFQKSMVQQLSDWKSSKDLGITEGLCGIALGLLVNQNNTDYRIVRTNNEANPLFLHPKDKESSKTVVFVPYEHSGAGTYKEELTSYLREQPNIALYILSITSDVDEYSIERTDSYIHIKIPKLKGTTDICDRMLKNYFNRVALLLKKDSFISKGAIFHFNHTDYNSFIPIIKDELNSKTVLTYHFLDGLATILTLKQESALSVNANLIDWAEIDHRNPKLFDWVICVSHFAQRILTKNYKIPLEKTRVIWNGTSSWSPSRITLEEKESLKKYFGLQPTKRVILYSGRLEARKGIKEFLEVAEKLCDSYDDIHFVLAGNGEFGDYLPMCKHFLNRVSFTGNMNKDDLQKLYHLSEIGVVPSKWEIFGYVPIEMMHSKLPVVATNVPGMNEIFSQYESNNYFVNVELSGDELKVDKLGLFNTISFLLDHPDKLQEYADGVFVYVKGFFSREIMGDKTVQFYNEI